MTRRFLHRASYAHSVLGRSKNQRPIADNNAPSMPLYLDLAERMSECVEQGGAHIGLHKEALGPLMWLVTRIRPDMAMGVQRSNKHMTTRRPNATATSL